MVAILADFWTISLTVIGSLISIITLLYSLALGKKDELHVILGIIRKGNNKNPQILAKEDFLINYIEKIGKLINKSFFIFLYSVSISIVLWIGCRLLSPKAQTCFFVWYFIISMFLCLLGFLLLALLLYKLIRQYQKELRL